MTILIHSFIFPTNAQYFYINSGPRRPYYVHGYASLWQSDLAQFFLSEEEIDSETPSQGYSYALVTQDIYCKKIYAVPMKSKTKEETQAAFMKTFDFYGAKPK